MGLDSRSLPLSFSGFEIEFHVYLAGQVLFEASDGYELMIQYLIGFAPN